MSRRQLRRWVEKGKLIKEGVPGDRLAGKRNGCLWSASKRKIEPDSENLDERGDGPQKITLKVPEATYGRSLASGGEGFKTALYIFNCFKWGGLINERNEICGEGIRVSGPERA